MMKTCKLVTHKIEKGDTTTTQELASDGARLFLAVRSVQLATAELYEVGIDQS